jgi:hypothetical protein
MARADTIDSPAPGTAPDSTRFPGKPCRRDSLPEWAVKQLPPLGTAKRLRDQDRGPGLTPPEAVAKKLCRRWSQLYAWNNEKGNGLPGLDEKLDQWHEYYVEADGAIRRKTVFSPEQFKRSKAALADRSDAIRRRRGLTDFDVMRRHPGHFACRAVRALEKPAAKMTDKELRPYRPTCLAHWRREKDEGKPSWHTGCPYLPDGRPIRHWIEHGRILNNPDDIETIVKRLVEFKEKEWTDPRTKIVYITTAAAEARGVTEQELTRCSKTPTTFLDGDGLFHPVRRPRGKPHTGDDPDRWRPRLWPKHEVELYIRRREEFHKTPREKVDRAKEFIRAKIAGGPVKASDTITSLTEAGFVPFTFRRALKDLRDAGELQMSPVGEQGYYWHHPGTPVTAQSERERAVEFLKALLAPGAIKAPEGMRICREEGRFAPGLVYAALQEAGARHTLVGRPGTAGQFHVWHLEGADPNRLQRQRKEAPTADQQPPAERRTDPQTRRRGQRGPGKETASRHEKILRCWEADKSQSNRAIARELGYDEKTVRNVLNEARAAEKRSSP